MCGYIHIHTYMYTIHLHIHMHTHIYDKFGDVPSSLRLGTPHPSDMGRPLEPNQYMVYVWYTLFIICIYIYIYIHTCRNPKPETLT